MVTGENGKTVQFQDIDSRHKVFGCYNENGDWEKEVFEVEEALDYIGLTEEKAPEAEKYTCSICGFTQGWEDTDDVHGDLWSCEMCGVTFCRKCSIEAIGQKGYTEMMQGGGYILCPECYRKTGGDVGEVAQ